MEAHLKSVVTLGLIMFCGALVFAAAANRVNEITTTDPDENLIINASGSQVIFEKDINATGDLSFYGELLPDGLTCSNGEILKRTGADNWDCASDETGGGGGAPAWLDLVGDFWPLNTSGSGRNITGNNQIVSNDALMIFRPDQDAFASPLGSGFSQASWAGTPRPVWYAETPNGRNMTMHYAESGSGASINFLANVAPSQTNPHTSSNAAQAKLLVYGGGGSSNYIQVTHDGTDGLLYTGSGDLKLTPTGGDVLVTGSNNLDVGGTLTKGGGSFKIDNPEDPRNEYLYHQFYESPEALLAYRGRGDTERTVSFDNHHGWRYTATARTGNRVDVSLPSWFDDLTWGGDTDEYTLQITGVGGFCGDSYAVFDEIQNNVFTIVTEQPCRFSWLLQAVRHDTFYTQNPMLVVENKTGGEAGRLRHGRSFNRTCNQTGRFCDVISGGG